MGQDLPPTGRFASAVDIEAWIDRHAGHVAVVDAAIKAADLGEPWHRFGPRFYPWLPDHPPYLRLGATWKTPVRAGIRVQCFGGYNRLSVWNQEWRSVTLDSADTDAVTLADDLWQAMQMVSIPPGPDLPHLKDAEGNLRQWCRLGCDLRPGPHGRLYCSCRI